VKTLLLLLAAILITPPVGSQTTQAQQSDSLDEVSRKLDILIEEIERMKLGEVVETRYEPRAGLGPAAAKVYHLKNTGVSIAGYGEIVYENYRKRKDDGTSAKKPDRIDFLRNVVYVGFRFNDWILFNSEIEFEHASTGKGGEVSVEFGYIELLFSKNLHLRAGMVLPPVGIINEKHEPPTFLTTIRPQVERLIIPATWRSNGVGLYGEVVALLRYSVYCVEGLNARQFGDSDGIRGGRQNGATAIAEDLAITARLEFDGLPGTVISTSFFSGNAGQGATDSLGPITASTTLLSAHAEFTWNGFTGRALAARTTVHQAGRVSTLAAKTVGSMMYGWYVIAGYNLLPLIVPASDQDLIPFVQYERLNTHARVETGFAANKAFDRSILTAGISYKPHPNVAFKFDFSDQKNTANTGINQWNIAVDYMY
jgi:hypothetical protein